MFKNRKLFLRKHRIKKKLEKENKALFIEEMVGFFWHLNIYFKAPVWEMSCHLKVGNYITEQMYFCIIVRSSILRPWLMTLTVNLFFSM